MSKPILLTTNEIGEDVRTTMREPELRVLPDYTEMMDPQPSASARPLSSLQRSPFHPTLTHMASFLFYATASASSHIAHALFQLVIPCECFFFHTSNKGNRPCVQSLVPCWTWTNKRRTNPGVPPPTSSLTQEVKCISVTLCGNPPLAIRRASWEGRGRWG